MTRRRRTRLLTRIRLFTLIAADYHRRGHNGMGSYCILEAQASRALLHAAGHVDL